MRSVSNLGILCLFLGCGRVGFDLPDGDAMDATSGDAGSDASMDGSARDAGADAAMDASSRDAGNDASMDGGDVPDAATDAGGTPLGAWGAPSAIARLNTSGREDDPTLTGDMLEIIFTSDRPGGAAETTSGRPPARRARVSGPFPCRSPSSTRLAARPRRS